MLFDAGEVRALGIGICCVALLLFVWVIWLLCQTTRLMADDFKWFLHKKRRKNLKKPEFLPKKRG